MRRLVLMAVAGWLAGAAGVVVADPAASPVRVVTSVAPLADLVARVGGDNIALTQLIPDGMDAHTFEPPPTSAKALAGAQLVLFNGLDLEESLLRMARANVPVGTPIILLGELVVPSSARLYDWSFPRSRGHPNPHVWLNVAYAIQEVEAIDRALASVNPGHADRYHERAGALTQQLTRLNQVIAATIQTIPPAHRLLVTYHDSWPYFARQYGLTVLGAVQPASFLEPSARDVARLIAQVRRTGVPAIFGSEVFPNQVVETIGREAGARYVDTLRDDVLPGPVGSPQHSYVGLMLENVRTMVAALGGDPAALVAVEPR